MKKGDLVQRNDSTLDNRTYWKERIGELGLVVEVNDRPFRVTEDNRNPGPGDKIIRFSPIPWSRTEYDSTIGRAVLIQTDQDVKWWELRNWTKVQ